jgi:hypothetical protein
VSHGLSYERYEADGFEEWMLRIGAPEAPPVLFLPPLFEEMNRTRALIAGVMRWLAAQGLCTWLPDLPGTGESERPLAAVGWEQWRSAVAAAAERIGPEGLRLVSIRGGALLDDAVPAPAWRFAPVAGGSLARDLERAGKLTGGGAAGYDASQALLEAMRATAPAEQRPLRTVRLASDPAPADAKLSGPALWRRSEPGNSSELSSAMASDIMEWIRTCAA